MRNSNRKSVINAVRGCFGNQGHVDYRGTKQTLARFLEVSRLRIAITSMLRQAFMHGVVPTVAAVAVVVEPTGSAASRQCRAWRGLRLVPAVVPIR